MSEPLSIKQHSAVARWWAAQDQKTIAAAWYAAGFTTIYSCMGFYELTSRLPDVAAAIGRSVIDRYQLRP